MCLSKMLQYLASNIYLLRRPTNINTNAIDIVLSYTRCEEDTLLNILTLHVPYYLYVSFDNKSIEFCRKVLSIIGKEKYNKLVEDRIIYSHYLTHELLSTIYALLSLTSINELNINPKGKPFLAHILNLPAGVYSKGTLSDESAKWFIDNYNPQMLSTLITFDASLLSNNILQQLLDIIVRNHIYIGSMDNSNIIMLCITKDCDMSRCKPLLNKTSTYVTYLIEYAIDGKRQSQKVLNRCITWPDYIWKCKLAKDFFKANFNKYTAINLHTCIRGNNNVNLVQLMEEYAMGE